MCREPALFSATKPHLLLSPIALRRFSCTRAHDSRSAPCCAQHAARPGCCAANLLPCAHVQLYVCVGWMCKLKGRDGGGDLSLSFLTTQGCMWALWFNSSPPLLWLLWLVRQVDGPVLPGFDRYIFGYRRARGRRIAWLGLRFWCF
jgi:hypothetical protein